MWFLLSVAVCVTYFCGLDAAPLVGADEPRYAQVGREMFERGDLVTPTLAGRNWFEKPALLYWLMYGAYALFGVSEFSARLGSALSGLVCILFVWLLARRSEAREPAELQGFGLLSAAVVGSCAGLIVFSHSASFDAPLTASVTLALACFFISEIETEKSLRRRWLAAFYVGVGLALLSKGLLGVVLPCGVIIVYFLLTRKRPAFSSLGLWWGVPLALALACLWYAPVVARHGSEFIDEFFIRQHFSRYVSNTYRHPQPFYFYVPVMAMLALPWTFFLGAAVWKFKSLRMCGDGVGEKLRAFSLAWLLVPLVFFSFSGSKLPAYVLPALPGAALLVSRLLLIYLRDESKAGVMRATGALTLCAAGAGLFYAARVDLISNKSAAAIMLPTLVAGVICLVFASSRRQLCAASLVGATCITTILIAALALEPFARRESVRGMLEAAEARGMGSLPIVEMHTIERTAEFYAAGRLVYGDDGQPVKLEGPWDAFFAARERGGRVLVLVPVEYVSQMKELPASVRWELVADNGAHALVYVEIVGE